MKKSPWLVFFGVVFVFAALFIFLLSSASISLFGGHAPSLKASNSILHLKIEGVIMDGKKFVEPLLKYRDDDRIKAILIEVNSPGGVVGPSQEMWAEINRTRKETKKPVVVASTTVMASGAYYAAVAADKIYVAPGTLVGSIGVIMDFMNLKGLYEWAKISRYTITTGKYKDSGAEYREMREDEKALFQELADEVWDQFKDAVAEGRNLDVKLVEEYADGRIMTGQKAVELGFADGVATLDEAFDKTAELAGLGSDYEVFTPPKERPGFWQMFTADEEEPYTKILNEVLRPELRNKPLFLMPGVL